MKEYSIVMALVDFVPVIFFAAGSVILMRDLYNKMSKGAFALFSAGLIDIVFAGALKALYKLLYAAGVCDFTALSDMFFPVQAIGFLLAGCGIAAMLCFDQGDTEAAVSGAAAAPQVFKGTFVFVGLVTAGLAMLDVSLCVLAKKLKKPGVIVVFILSLILSLCMGYLSSRDFTEASMNWIAEGMNILAEGTFFLGALLAHKAGLAELKLEKAEE